jgi:hypothetical protein
MVSAKKISTLGALLFINMFCVYMETGFTQSQEIANMSASVSVNPVFSMDVFPTSMDFSSVDPGTTTETRELTLRCSTNNNNPWSLLLSDASELTSGAFTIPNNNFHWWGWSSGSGTWYAGTATMSTIPFTSYECGMDEYITVAPVEIHLTFNVDVPANQAAGTYTTTLVITMTE